jgi:hypothetical protein
LNSPIAKGIDMTLHKSIPTAAVAVVLALWTDNSLYAADYPSVPAPVMGQAGMATTAAPVSGCPTCGTAGPRVTGSSCATCGSSWFHKHDKGPYVVNLCPGACFGYFQTQWRKWDDVCPYPYQGIGVSDAPRPPAPALPGISKPGTTIPGPRPVEPKTSDSKPMSYFNQLPPIPVPGNGN